MAEYGKVDEIAVETVLEGAARVRIETEMRGWMELTLTALVGVRWKVSGYTS